MTFFFSLLTGLPGFLNGVLTYLNKKQDVDLEKFRVGSNDGRDVSIAMIQSEIAARQTNKDVVLAGMTHPIWWVAWTVFVIPVGLRDAALHLVSLLHLDYPIPPLPEIQEARDGIIVGSIFGAQIATGALSAVARRWIGK